MVSEIVTGGASAADEMIELHNPTDGPLPLEGLEVIYVSASGSTVSRRAGWNLGAAVVPAGGHVLIANEAGLFAVIADATYSSGMSSTGGSVAIRILGATTQVDGVGWGTADGTWLEGRPAAAPGAGASIERLPGGSNGSGQDTDDNATDFVVRDVPAPQNLASPPTRAGDPTGPTPQPTPVPPAPSTPMPTPVATPPGPASMPIADARDLADGATATVEGVALTSSGFHDGGGFVADASGGIAVLVVDGGFARGERLRLTGQVDDRFAQRTLRVESAGLAVTGSADDPSARLVPTGGVGEDVEGTLVRVTGTIAGSGSPLTSGVAFDLDDGSGATRLVIGATSGVDTDAWRAGTRVAVLGVVGQRDSSGTGASGYRVLPRDAADVLEVSPPSPGTSPGPSGPGGASPSGAPSPGVVPIEAARAAARNTPLVVRGVVTLPSGVVDADTAVIQDATGAIVLRLGDDAGSLRAGQRIEVAGTRSTKSGMETLRVTRPARHLGSASLPAAPSIRSGAAGEEHEARLIVVRGALVTSARRAASGSVSFEIDDGSGPLKVGLGSALSADSSALAAGTWVEVRGVLGQQTTGSEPRAGYRVWPASRAAVRVVASPTPAGSGGGGGAGGTEGESAPSTSGLADVGEPGLADLRVGATLVAGPWPELGIGGLLWDGSRLVAIHRASAGPVESAMDARRPPIALELGGLAAGGIEPVSGVPIVILSADPGDVAATSGPVAPPLSKLTSTAGWVSLIGDIGAASGVTTLRVRGELVRLVGRCSDERLPTRGVVSVNGIALIGPPRIVVPCGGVRSVPGLARSAGAAGAPTRPERLARVADAAATHDPRPLAVGLLMVGAGALASVAVAQRFRRGVGGLGSEPPPPGPGPTGDIEGEPPRLTLVSVPREHGP